MSWPGTEAPRWSRSRSERTATLPAPVAITLCAPMKRATNSERGRLNTSRGEPVCSMQPWFITTIWSASAIASSCECVTWTNVNPSSCCQRFNSARICTRRKGSSAESGSSSSSTRGSVISARAKATRCKVLDISCRQDIVDYVRCRCQPEGEQEEERYQILGRHKGVLGIGRMHLRIPKIGHVHVYSRQDKVDVLQSPRSSDDHRPYEQNSCQYHYSLHQ